MSDCCSSSASDVLHPHKRRCPGCGAEGAEVAERTIVHHVRNAWDWKSGETRHFFCEERGCDVVYFGADDSVIRKSQLRTAVGLKESPDDGLICYCFGVSRADALHVSGVRDYVVEQTRLGLCSCATSNPSGRCCLKNFPKTQK
jgi:hypothetical protein